MPSGVLSSNREGQRRARSVVERADRLSGEMSISRLGGVDEGDPSMLTGRYQDVLAKFLAVEVLKDPTRGVAADEPLISSGLIDSFNLVDLALFVEETFGVRIEDSELTSDVFDTLDELVSLIAKRQSSSL